MIHRSRAEHSVRRGYPNASAICFVLLRGLQPATSTGVLDRTRPNLSRSASDGRKHVSLARVIADTGTDLPASGASRPGRTACQSALRRCLQLKICAETQSQSPIFSSLTTDATLSFPLSKYVWLIVHGQLEVPSSFRLAFRRDPKKEKKLLRFGHAVPSVTLPGWAF